jgi:pimeloyl-ACP methyl ester carboxylesterase
VTLVLLPGMDGTGLLFAAFLKALGDSVNPLVVSFPPDKPLTYHQLEEFVRPKLPANGPWMLLGESFSGPVAIALAARNPPGLAGLLLCCTFVRSPLPPGVPFAWLSSFFDPRVVPMAIVSRIVYGHFSTSRLAAQLKRAIERVAPAVFRARLREVLDADVRAEMSKVAVPVLYLRGSGDPLVSAGAGEQVRELCPRTRVVEIDAPHGVLQSHPVEASVEVRRFIDEIAREAKP